MSDEYSDDQLGLDPVVRSLNLLNEIQKETQELAEMVRAKYDEMRSQRDK